MTSESITLEVSRGIRLQGFVQFYMFSMFYGYMTGSLGLNEVNNMYISTYHGTSRVNAILKSILKYGFYFFSRSGFNQNLINQ